ncbi:hypothetical protein [Methanolobus psychrotolerans]|uniref:hypothetical protein n=1 Tax=Methanolobus psychrotolerans TaxID=1874706 RepID=UPI00101AD824|nr:hypothetical protein [Methanolobus psychrotolerans]
MILPLGVIAAENSIDYTAYRNNWDLLNENKDDWVCVDHAVNYSRNNPGWGIVIISPSPRFSVQPHMTNYKIDANRLLIHEAQINITYELEIVNGTMTVPYYEDFPGVFSKHWESGTYFHFIPNETGVVRVYTMLKDNRDEFFDYEYISLDDLGNTTVELDDNIGSMVLENNAVNLIDKSTISHNTTTNDSHLENIDEPGSYTTKLIRFIKSFIGLLK